MDDASVASGGFMINLQAVLLRFAEPFMDAKYSKASRFKWRLGGLQSDNVKD